MYASKQPFGGQRASVGRSVLLKVGPSHGAASCELIPATIEKVDSADLPCFRDSTGRYFHGTLLTFQPSTAENVDSLPGDSWTWPPRV